MIYHDLVRPDLTPSRATRYGHVSQHDNIPPAEPAINGSAASSSNVPANAPAPATGPHATIAAPLAEPSTSASAAAIAAPPAGPWHPATIEEANSHRLVIEIWPGPICGTCWAASCDCGYVFDNVTHAHARWPNGRLRCFACREPEHQGDDMW